MSLGVRVDAETPLAADGQYIPFMMSSVGRLLVETQGGAGGTSETDSDPFTPATDAYVPVGGIFDDVAPADLVEGDGGVVRMSAVREMYMNIRDGAGGERSANVTAAFELNVIATAQPGVDIGDVDILSGPTGASAFEVQGTAADGAAAVGNPVLVAGEESGGNIQSLLTDSDPPYFLLPLCPVPISLPRYLMSSTAILPSFNGFLPQPLQIWITTAVLN